MKQTLAKPGTGEEVVKGIADVSTRHIINHIAKVSAWLNKG